MVPELRFETLDGLLRPVQTGANTAQAELGGERGRPRVLVARVGPLRVCFDLGQIAV